MKSRINLYLPELHPKLEVLTLSFVLTVWAILFTIVGLVYYHDYSHGQSVKTDLMTIEVQKQEVEGRLAELNETLANRTKDPKLLAAIESKQLEVSLKQRVIDELSGQEQFKSNGFAGLMSGLAEHHLDGLWLTRIQLDENQVMLEGGATDSSLIPQWMTQLSLTERLKGQEFSTTKLYRDPNQQLMFTLGTKAISDSQAKEQP
jgi:Tfp pilus assembly protein PilN